MASDEIDAPVAVRYPNATENKRIVKEFFEREGEEARLTHANFAKNSRKDAVIVTYGAVAGEALKAQELLREEGVAAGVILLERLKPYNLTAAEITALLPLSVKAVVFLEEGIEAGGASMLLLHELREEFDRRAVRTAIHAIPDRFVRPTVRTTLYRDCALTGEDVAKTVRKLLKA